VVLDHQDRQAQVLAGEVWPEAQEVRDVTDVYTGCGTGAIARMLARAESECRVGNCLCTIAHPMVRPA
jgi:hypothetical protein